MGRIYSDSTLNAFECMARGLDTLKPRHGKSGPARQGQAWHAWISLYLKHLLKTGLPSDFDEAQKIWLGVTALVGADDVADVEDVVKEHMDLGYRWFLEGSEQAAEETIFVTLDRRVVPAERALELSAPLFRFTADLRWRGRGPVLDDTTVLNDSFGLAGSVAHIMDWKTHHHIEHVDSPKNNRQLLRYAAAAFPEDDAVVAWLGFPRRRYYEKDSFSRAQLDTAWHELVVTPIEQLERLFDSGAINTLNPERVVGPQCKYCDLRKGCDAALRYPVEISEVEAATPEQRLVALALTEKLADDLKETLKDTISQRGSITSGAIQYRYSESRSVDYDWKRVTEVLNEHLTPTQINRALSITTTSLKRALKEAKVPAKTAKALVEACAVGAPVKLSTSARVMKAGEERAREREGDDRSGRPEGVGDLE